MKRRDFIAGTGGVLATSTAFVSGAQPVGARPTASQNSCTRFNGPYQGDYLDRIAFPLGGIGAGMFCIEGSGALSKFSLRNEPDLTKERAVFAAVSVQGDKPFTRVLEGPVPRHKLPQSFTHDQWFNVNAAWGLPRFRHASFQARFPFATVTLADSDSPVQVHLTAWSPFEPGDEDNASLPVAAIEYTFTNSTPRPLAAVFSFNAANLMVEPAFPLPDAEAHIGSIPRGFTLHAAVNGKPWAQGGFAVCADDPDVKVDHAWFRSRQGESAAIGILWDNLKRGECYARPPVVAGEPAPGASLFIPFSLQPGATRTIVLRFAWYAPHSNLNLPGGKDSAEFVFDHEHFRVPPEQPCYQPWYVSQFPDLPSVMAYWEERYDSLRRRSAQFSDALYDSTLPAEVLEAVAANLTILKSPTVLRQTDGRFWAWEGTNEHSGSCSGSCTHVWNYAQALPHLFPRLERSLRETEFDCNQNTEGHQDFRAAIPIRPTPHNFHAAADGQLGGIMKVYREWRISGNEAWLRSLWPKIRASLDYCIRTWDPRQVGWIEEPHHNTYDIEFWGPEGLCTGFYLGALQAATLMGRALGDPVERYAKLIEEGKRRMESELFNGEHFFQRANWHDLRARFPDASLKWNPAPFSSEELELATREGPPNQYGEGCLSDGVAGAWLGWACGMGDVLNNKKVSQHLEAVFRYNFCADLTTSENPALAGRSVFAAAPEGGLLLCTWPTGGKPAIPFHYHGEVWTGVEYQVASHLISMGCIEQGLHIIAACRRRYDGRLRNPFSEAEAGHWYARAMSSYALLQAFTGARFDAVEKTLYLKPVVKGDFRCFLSTATGYGTVGVRGGEPFVEVVSGRIPYERIAYTAAGP